MRLHYVLLLFTFSVLSFKNTTTAQSINSEVAETNPLYFSKVELTKKTGDEPVFCDTFTLNTDDFLNIHFTLEKPLVKSLETLAPDLSEAELLEAGNFQFTFLVNDEIIYVENLNTGAGLAPSKTERLKHNIRLVAPKQLDYWGWYLWMK